MALALVLSLVLGLEAPSPALLPAAGGDECWTQPLQLTLPELAGMGGIANQLRRNHCLQKEGGGFARYIDRPMTVGKTRFGKVWIFGQPVGFGVDVFYRPSLFAGDGRLRADFLERPEELYPMPALDLPEPWMLAVEKATYPVLAVGGVAIFSYVLFSLAHP